MHDRCGYPLNYRRVTCNYWHRNSGASELQQRDVFVLLFFLFFSSASMTILWNGYWNERACVRGMPIIYMVRRQSWDIVLCRHDALFSGRTSAHVRPRKRMCRFYISAIGHLHLTAVTMISQRPEIAYPISCGAQRWSVVILAVVEWFRRKLIRRRSGFGEETLVKTDSAPRRSTRADRRSADIVACHL